MHETDRRIKPARIGARSSQAARRRALEVRRARFSNAVEVSRTTFKSGGMELRAPSRDGTHPGKGDFSVIRQYASNRKFSRAAVQDDEARGAGIDALAQQALREIVEEVVRQEIEQKTARLDLRLEPQERVTIEKAAKLSGRSLSDFVVHAAYQAALANIESEVVLRLSRRDSESLLAALDDPAEPNAALLRAAGRRQQVMQTSRPTEASPRKSRDK